MQGFPPLPQAPAPRPNTAVWTLAGAALAVLAGLGFGGWLLLTQADEATMPTPSESQEIISEEPVRQSTTFCTRGPFHDADERNRTDSELASSASLVTGPLRTEFVDGVEWDLVRNERRQAHYWILADAEHTPMEINGFCKADG